MLSASAFFPCKVPFVVGSIRKLSLATTNCTAMSGGGNGCKKKNRNYVELVVMGGGGGGNGGAVDGKQ